MSVKRSWAQALKVVKLAANAPLKLENLNEMTGVVFVFADPQTDVQITEASTVDPSMDGAVPLERLVFNESQVSIGQVTLNETDDKFTTTAPASVGWFVSAYHDTLKCNKDCIVLLHGREDWKDHA